MIRLIYRIKHFLNLNTHEKKRSIYKKIFNILDFFYILEIYFTIQVYINYYFKKKKKSRKVVISLTSYPQRYNKLYLTILSLLSQSTNPHKIILWISKNDYKKLPKKVLSLRNNVFEIRQTKKDLKNFNKLVHCKEINKKYKIITADDDTYYPFNWLFFLIKKNSTKKIIYGHRGHLIKINNNKIDPYLSWKSEIYSKNSSKKIFLTGVGGIIYPKKFLKRKMLNHKIYNKICEPDDVWFYYMARKEGYSFSLINKYIKFYSWKSNTSKLSDKITANNNYNDKAIKNMQKKYKLNY